MEKTAWFVGCDGWDRETQSYDTKDEALEAIKNYLSEDVWHGESHYTYFLYKGALITTARLKQEPTIDWKTF